MEKNTKAQSFYGLTKLYNIEIKEKTDLRFYEFTILQFFITLTPGFDVGEIEPFSRLKPLQRLMS